MTLQRVHLRMWRFAKGVPYGTLLWFDEQKEIPELFKVEGGVTPPETCDSPLDSGVDPEQVDIPLSVSAFPHTLELSD